MYFKVDTYRKKRFYQLGVGFYSTLKFHTLAQVIRASSKCVFVVSFFLKINFRVFQKNAIYKPIVSDTVLFPLIMTAINFLLLKFFLKCFRKRCALGWLTDLETKSFNSLFWNQYRIFWIYAILEKLVILKSVQNFFDDMIKK